MMRDVTWRERSSQVRVAATGKARSPTVDSRVRRTDSDDVDDVDILYNYLHSVNESDQLDAV